MSARFSKEFDDRLYTRTNVHARVRAPTVAAKRKRRKKACRFCGSAHRLRGCTDNCQKYGRRAYVTNVIYRVIMGAINSSSFGSDCLLFVVTFQGIPGKMRDIVL